jgi:cytochrome b561
MNNSINWISFLRRISSLLLLLSVVLQIFIVILLDVFEENIEEFELDEIHEVTGLILLGLMLVHIALYWKSLLPLFSFKTK